MDKGLGGKTGTKVPELVGNGSAGLPVYPDSSAFMLGMVSPVLPGKPQEGKGKQYSPRFLGRKGFDLDIARINMLESRENEEKN